MGTRTFLWLAGLLASIALAAAGFQQHRRAVTLGAEIQVLKSRQALAASLEKENHRLETERAAAGDPATLRKANRQAGMLRSEIQRLTLKAHNLAVAAAPAGHAPDPVWPQDATVVPAKEWTYAGMETLHAAMESVLWAAREGDVDKLAGLINLRPAERDQAERYLAGLPAAARAQYGSPENLVATLIAANLPTDYTAMAPLGEGSGKDRALLGVRVEQASGQQQDFTFQFQHSDAGWKIDIPGRAIAGFERQLRSP